MHLLIEDYKYKLADSPYFSSKAFMNELDGEFYKYGKKTVSFGCVGYYYSRYLNDCVIILPKVIIIKDKRSQNETLLIGDGNLTPAKVFDLDNECKVYMSDSLTSAKQDLKVFGVWIYRALAHYDSDNRSNSIISRITTLPTREDGSSRRSGSLLETILELLRFNHLNSCFISRIIAESHMGSRIKWNKTLSRKKPILKNGIPYYTDPVRRKSQPNYKDELIIIYFSILRYITKTFGFAHNTAYGIELIADNVFETYIEGRGKLRLWQIKNNYFSDEALRLWHLCMAFFDEIYALTKNPAARDHLMAKSFHQVFEDMVDFMIESTSDKEFKTFKDRRRIDHIYKYESLIGSGEGYYIGDSKYYALLKDEHGDIMPDLPEDSIEKQYIYALNVQQLLKERGDRSIFDDVTEGYTFIPNFFISGSLNSSMSDSSQKYRLSYDDDGLEMANDCYVRKHFGDRLFDRNTLKLFHFNVNFLYVLKAYALRRKTWRNKVRQTIRDSIKNKLLGANGIYSLYELDGNTDMISNMSWSEYKTLYGKIIAQSGRYYLAVRKESKSSGIKEITLLKSKGIITTEVLV